MKEGALKLCCKHICFLTISTEINGVGLFSSLCAHSLSALVVAASLEWDLDDLVSHTHIQLAAAVQDQQAPDMLPLPGREQLDLFQKAAPRGLVERGKHFLDSTVIWKRKG